MAPNRHCLVKAPSPQKKHIPIKPLTTQGKIEKAQRQKEAQLKNKPREAPNTTTPNAKSFAPPDELDQLAHETKMRSLAASKRATIRDGKWDFFKGKALTTQQKEAQARGAKNTKGGVQAGRFDALDLLQEGNASSAVELSFGDQPMPPKCEEPEQRTASGRKNDTLPRLTETLGVRKKTSTPGSRTEGSIAEAVGVKKTKTKAPKPPGLMKILSGMTHEPTALPMRKPISRAESVLMRPTRGAVRVKERERDRSPLPVTKTAVSALDKLRAKRGLKKSRISILDLPDEVRARIWRFAVVKTKFPVWPAKAEGREQPDLAMTSRQIREEVLPIYYSENTFAINLKKEEILKALPGVVDTSGGKKGKDLTGLAAIGKWARILKDTNNEGGKWFGMIKSWAFDYDDAKEGKSFLVSLRFDASADRRGFGTVSGLNSELLAWSSSPAIEVHKFAACVMPGSSDCGRCIIKTSPAQLQEAVIHMLENGKMTASNLVQLAREMRGMFDRLSLARCKSRGG